MHHIETAEFKPGSFNCWHRRSTAERRKYLKKSLIEVASLCWAVAEREASSVNEIFPVRKSILVDPARGIK